MTVTRQENLPEQSPGHLTAPIPLRIELSHHPAPDNSDTLLAQFGHGTLVNTPAPHAAHSHGLNDLANSPAFETWHTARVHARGCDQGIDWRASEHLLFGSIAIDSTQDCAGTAYEVYQRIFQLLADLDFSYLVRSWNFMSRINQGEGDNEVYKLFCSGRAQAFDEHANIKLQLPAATAVGIPCSEENAGQDQLVVHFLAAREAGVRIENPRQMSAPDYPRRYGPRSPQFARATAWPNNPPAVLLVSGTASIVGHESTHLHDLDRQLAETWENIDLLCKSASAEQPLLLRVYIRDPSDYVKTHAFVAERVHKDIPVFYLQADICRAELLLEIEAVYRIRAEQG